MFDSPQGIENRLAVGSAAQNRFILDRWQVRPLLERCEEAGDGDHQPGGFQTAGGPEVPAESHPIPVLVLLDELLIGRHHQASQKKSPEHQSEIVGPMLGNVSAPVLTSLCLPVL